MESGQDISRKRKRGPEEDEEYTGDEGNSEDLGDVENTLNDSSYFAVLPNEMLVQLCYTMDTPQLLSLSQSYSRVYQVCKDVIKERRDNILIERKNTLREGLSKGILDVYKGDIRLTIIPDIQKAQLIVTQSGNDIGLLYNIPFILPGEQYTIDVVPSFNKQFIVRGTVVSFDMLDQLLDQIIIQDYK